MIRSPLVVVVRKCIFLSWTQESAKMKSPISMNNRVCDEIRPRHPRNKVVEVVEWCAETKRIKRAILGAEMSLLTQVLLILPLLPLKFSFSFSFFVSSY